MICCFNAEFEALLILGYHGKKGDLCLVKSDSVHHQQERLSEKKAVRSAKRELGLSFHCLRHTLTSWGKQSGISGPVMQDIVGHDSEAVSREYTHIDLETKRVALDSIENPFDNDNESKVVKLKA